MNSLSKSDLTFLDQGGEMGELTRKFNWALTPVGPPEQWPQSLKTIVSVILNSKFPMFLWWGNDLIQFYNDAYRPSLGNNGKHPLALGQKGVDCWPEIWPTIKPLIDKVLEKGEASWHEDQLIPIYRNGKLEDVYWTFSYSPVKVENGNVGGLLVVCTETTEKVLNIIALKESEDRLRFAIEATLLGTWEHIPATGKFNANDTLREWFGFNELEDIDLNDAFMAMHVNDRERVIEAISKALEYESGGTYAVEYTIVNRITGKERIVKARGKTVFNEEKIAIRFSGTLQDITSEVISRKIIEEAEERTRLAVEAGGLGTYVLDLKTDKIITSQRMDEIFGVEMSDEHETYLMPLHPDDRPIREAAFELAKKTGSIKYEARIVLRNNSIKWIKVSGSVFKDEQGEPLKILGLIQDITEQKEIEKQKDDFIKIVSHELKTPLTSIFGYSDLLIDKFELLDDTETTFLLGRMKSQILRLTLIIQDMMDASRIEENKMMFREDTFELSELISQITEEMQLVNSGYQLTIKENPALMVTADKERISQVITNLLTNAVKYSPQSNNIIINSIVGDKEFIVSVQDFGLGIAFENQEKIFERFYQVTSGGKFNSGLGMGLYISSEIIKRQGGKLWVKSEPGKGSVFYFSIPLK